MSKSPKAFLVPKLIYFIWYIKRPDIFSFNGFQVTAKLTPLSRSLNTYNYRLKEYFAKLQDIGCISDLRAEYGKVHFRLGIPPTLLTISDQLKAVNDE